MCSCVNISFFVCFRFWIYNVFIFTVSSICCARDCDLQTSSVTCRLLDWTTRTTRYFLITLIQIYNNNEEDNSHLQLNT